MSSDASCAEISQHATHGFTVRGGADAGAPAAAPAASPPAGKRWVACAALVACACAYATFAYQEPRAARLIGGTSIAYAVGYLAQWDNFFRQIEPVAAARPCHA